MAYAWGQEEMGLNFKRPLRDRAGRKLWDVQGGGPLLCTWSVVCGPGLTPSLGSVLEMRVSGPSSDLLKQNPRFSEVPGD